MRCTFRRPRWSRAASRSCARRSSKAACTCRCAAPSTIRRPGACCIADVASHVARIFAKETKLTEDEALERIRSMFDAEMDAPTDPGSTSAIS